ncbi:MAG: hypothetical protein IPJ81_02240 [Chitinophagaceae bacterium]|nr:hypothetical protein [Chitinophagaceae bacterium]
MKKFKIMDMWISIILIIFSITRSIIFYDRFLGPYFLHVKDDIIQGYFIVGGWQVISMLVHTFKKWFTIKGNKRFYYQIIVLTIILISILLIVFKSDGIAFMLFFLLAVTPFMAIYYTYICYHEIYIKMKRPLDQLK